MSVRLSVAEFVALLCDAFGWPRTRPPRVVLGERAAFVRHATLCLSDDAATGLPDPTQVAVLVHPPGAGLARVGRRTADPFIIEGPAADWAKAERVVIDASEVLAGGRGGLDQLLAEALGLEAAHPAAPVPLDECKFVGFVPLEAVEPVRAALFAAGAGRIGAYTECSWGVEGTGTFRGSAEANPAVGERGAFEQVRELRLETVVRAHLRDAVVRAFVDAHPYEEPAYDVYPLLTPSAVGHGRIVDSGVAVEDLRRQLETSFGRVQRLDPSGTPRAGGRVVVTARGAGAVLEAVLADEQVDRLVAGSLTAAERALLGERGVTVLIASAEALAEACAGRLASQIGSATGLDVRTAAALRFPAEADAFPADVEANGSPSAAPGAGRWRLHFDGGSRGNPGPAAYGWVLYDPAGTERARGCEVIGTATNNAAEYTGLVEGLRNALGHGVTELDVRGDSELIVKQLRGEYKVKNAALRPLYDQARQLLGQLDSWGVEHVYRSDNAVADSLVNEALDA